MATSVLEIQRSRVLSSDIGAAAGTAYLFVLFAAGFFTNFLPIGTINTGTVLVFAFAGILSLTGTLYLLNPMPKPIAVAAFSTVIVSVLMVIKSALDTNPLNERVEGLLIYFLGVWPALFFMQANTAKVRQRLLTALGVGLFGLSVFSIFQSIFANSLPLSLFVLRGDNPFGAGEDVLRPTGLTGNPIIFSSILVFASALFLAQWLETHRFRFLLALVCSFVANYVTYTRASVILVIPVLLLVWLFNKRFRIKHKIVALIAVALIIAVGRYVYVNAVELIIIQRLQQSTPESLRSTIAHFEQIENARNAIASNPWTGTGMGSQGDAVGPEKVIITDGAWWILLLEFGVPLTILIVALLIIVLIPLAKYVLRPDSGNRALAIATLSFHAYIFPSNFINSALLGHISFGLYWVVLGLSLASANYNFGSRRDLVRLL